MINGVSLEAHFENSRDLSVCHVSKNNTAPPLAMQVDAGILKLLYCFIPIHHQSSEVLLPLRAQIYSPDACTTS